MDELSAAIVDALATRLEAAFTAAALDVAVYRGASVDASGDARLMYDEPCVVLLPGNQQDEGGLLGSTLQREIDPSPDDPTKIRMIWLRGFRSLDLDLWIYTQTKTARDAIAPSIRAALLPYGVDHMPRSLMLTLSDLYSSKARLDVLSEQSRDESGGGDGYAAYLIRLRASFGLLDHHDVARATRTVEAQ